MKRSTQSTTTLLALVETVSDYSRNDVETIAVVNRILSRHRFVMPGNDQHTERFSSQLASLPAVA